MPVWYLVAGKTGAGKSTHARKSAKEHSAIHFSIDEWMANLFWMDCPEKNDYPWAIERVNRCETQIATMARQLATQGTSSVLDLGFTQREQRTKWRVWAAAAGVGCQVEVIDPPAEIRWQRVCERNQGTSETFSFAVTREMFDAMEAMWEPVGEDERTSLCEKHE